MYCLDLIRLSPPPKWLVMTVVRYSLFVLKVPTFRLIALVQEIALKYLWWCEVCMCMCEMFMHRLTWRCTALPTVRYRRRWSWCIERCIWLCCAPATPIPTLPSATSVFHFRFSFAIVAVCFPSVLWHCLLGDKKGIRLVKSWVLVCWWWHFDCSFALQLSPPPLQWNPQ